MKRCPSCGVQKPHSDFTRNRRRPDGLQSYCTDCSRAYQRRHYARYSEKYRARAQVRNEQKRAVIRRIIKAAKARPCADCGVEYPAFVMDFDHLDPRQKRFTIGHAYRTWRTSELLAEIRKCDVVCANCHRIRTYGRRSELGRQDSNLD